MTVKNITTTLTLCLFSLAASARSFELATGSFGLPHDLRATEVIQVDLNSDLYPDFIFVDGASHPTKVRAFLNKRGKLDELKVSGASDLPKYTTFKVARDLWMPGWHGVITKTAASDKSPGHHETRAYNLVLRNSELIFVARPMRNMPKGEFGDIQFLDHNQDGRLDFVISSFYTEYGKSYEAGPIVLMEGLADGKFLNKAVQLGLTPSRKLSPQHKNANVPSYELSICNVTSDFRPEILVPAYGRRWNKLFTRRGSKYTDIARNMGFHADDVGVRNFRGNGNSFVAACADADNDGFIDVFQGEITHQWAGEESDKSAMLWNEGGRRFTRTTNLPRPKTFHNQGDLGSMFGDYDLDGWQDLMVANSDYPPETNLLLWRQSSRRKFTDVSQELGSSFLNPIGSIFVDIDLDGDLDIVSGSSSMRGNSEPYARIYRNLAIENRTRNDWIGIYLEGNGQDVPREAYGSRVTLQANGMKMTRELYSGFGQNMSLSGAPLNFGLGPNVRTVQVTVTWSDGKVKSYTLGTGRYHQLKY